MRVFENESCYRQFSQELKVHGNSSPIRCRKLQRGQAFRQSTEGNIWFPCCHHSVAHFKKLPFPASWGTRARLPPGMVVGNSFPCRSGRHPALLHVPPPPPGPLFGHDPAVVATPRSLAVSPSGILSFPTTLWFRSLTLVCCLTNPSWHESLWCLHVGFHMGK